MKIKGWMEVDDDADAAVTTGPPVPPPSVRVSEKSSKVKSSSVLFRFNCSWFSDANGAVRYFAVIVSESDGKKQTPSHHVNDTQVHTLNFLFEQIDY